MHILIAPDKFKGSLTAIQVCDAIESGIKSMLPSARITKLPLADGGEGTLDLLEQCLSLNRIEVMVSDPLMRPIKTYYLSDGNTAYIEMAKASGLQLLKPEERNPWSATSFGTGQLIANAVNTGVKKVVLLIGGSATSDAGIGMAAALGFMFKDRLGNVLEANASSLEGINSIEIGGVLNGLSWVEFTVWSDVKNPLFGVNGAAHVYGVQKGANQEMVLKIDRGLKSFAKVMNNDFETKEGAGAAGGLGYGAMSFLNAKLESGIEAVLKLRNLESHLQEVDLVISGEGKLDGQTLEGKVIAGVSNAAKARNIPFAIVCGRKEERELGRNNFNAIAILDIRSRTKSDEDAMKNAAFYLEQLAAEILKELLKSS
jgi:glycerate kinase